jgi:hypothetical protein
VGKRFSNEEEKEILEHYKDFVPNKTGATNEQ